MAGSSPERLLPAFGCTESKTMVGQMMSDTGPSWCARKRLAGSR